MNAGGFAELAETALRPSPARLLQDVDADLRPFFEKAYERPEMTDLVWLNMFRILSSRMGREKHFVILILYLPMEEGLLREICAGFKAIAGRHRLKNDMGFITPIDGGKRCILEYDYFLDPNDPEEAGRMRQAALEAGGLVMGYSAKMGTIRWMPFIVNQGCSRKENLLYT